MQKEDHIFHYPGDFVLEAGGILPGFQLKYTTFGQLNRERDNVVWVCHALTGSSDVTSWWGGLFSDGSPLDSSSHFILCANALGGCYGSTGPLSVDPRTGRPFYHDFPLITHRDIVGAFDLLRAHLGIERIHTLTGGSMGGQQAVEWAVQQPDVFRNLIPMASNAVHSPWGIALNEAQRMAIAADSTWLTDDPRAGLNGMKAARAMALISYRAYETFTTTQAEPKSGKLDDFRAASYQQYQGRKLVNRFNAFTYWTFSKAMDSHDVGRHATVQDALRKIKAKTLVIGIDSDVLFPLAEQRLLAEQINGARLEVLHSVYGHDGFLTDLDLVKDMIRKFYKQENAQIAV